MTLTIDVSKELEAALKTQARGVDTAGYARQVLKRALGMGEENPGPPFKTGRGLLAKYGPALSAEEIDANRADMFKGFGENAP